jgi:hypothetical protein
MSNKLYYKMWDRLIKWPPAWLGSRDRDIVSLSTFDQKIFSLIIENDINKALKLEYDT